MNYTLWVVLRPGIAPLTSVALSFLFLSRFQNTLLFLNITQKTRHFSWEILCVKFSSSWYSYLPRTSIYLFSSFSSSSIASLLLGHVRSHFGGGTFPSLRDSEPLSALFYGVILLSFCHAKGCAACDGSWVLLVRARGPKTPLALPPVSCL